MEKMYDYVFHYSHLTKQWNAIPREVYNEYWNNNNVDGVLKSKNISTLMELIEKGEDFIKSID